MVTITVNGVRREVQAPTDTPLLYVLRNDLELSGPQFGCGLAQCGACSVLLGGKEIRSCVTPLSAATAAEITTLEGLPARWAKQKGLPAGRRRKDAPPRAAGMDRGADAPLRILPERHDDQSHRTAGERRGAHRRPNQSCVYDLGPSAHLCRCGSYTAIIEAVQRASTRHGERRQGMNLRKNNARLISETNQVARNQATERDEVPESK